MRWWLPLLVVFGAACSSFGTEPAAGGPDGGTEPSSDAGGRVEDGGADGARDADGDAPPLPPFSCPPAAKFCETFDDDNDDGPLAAWTVTNEHDAFALDTARSTSSPASGRLVLDSTPERDRYFAAYRSLGAAGAIDVELDVLKRGNDERVFEIHWPNGNGLMQFDTSGKVLLESTVGPVTSKGTLVGTPAQVGDQFVHVRVRIALAMRYIRYEVGGITCFDGNFDDIIFEGEARFQLVGFAARGVVAKQIDMNWDNIAVVASP